MKVRQNRRSFLGLGISGLGIWALDSVQTRLFASGLSSESSGSGPILVVVQLSGGNDGLNTVIPVDDPEYAKARRRLGIEKKDALPLDSAFSLHPSMKGAAELFRGGKLAIVHGVGYPNPNRSHFKSMDIWHSADPSGRDQRFGWLGRALDLMAHDGEGEPELGVNIANRVPLSLKGSRYKPVSFQDPNLFRFLGSDDESEAFDDLCKKESEGDNLTLNALRRAAHEALASSKRIRTTIQAYRTPVRYPRSRVSASLRMVAGLIAGQLPTRVYYTEHGGFDTHVNQAFRHAQLLTQLDQALTAFQKDLERQGLAEQVVVLAFSEFGRRVRENQSAGTDHGVAAPVFLAGSRVRGGFHGEFPSLVDLDRGDLKHSVDFRQVYAAVLDRWLGVDSRKVLRGRFPGLAVLG